MYVKENAEHSRVRDLPSNLGVYHKITECLFFGIYSLVRATKKTLTTHIKLLCMWHHLIIYKASYIPSSNRCFYFAAKCCICIHDDLFGNIYSQCECKENLKYIFFLSAVGQAKEKNKAMNNTK